MTLAAVEDAVPDLSACPFRPLEDWCVIRPANEMDVTSFGLYVPATIDDVPQQGDVMSVGPGKRTARGERVVPDVQAGDRVLYTRFAPTHVDYDGVRYLLIRASELLSRVDRTSA